MDAELINLFVEATDEVLSTMAQAKATAGSPSLKKGAATWGVVTGMIGLAGDRLSGSMLVSFDEPAILGIVSKMLMEEFSEVTQDVIDAVGEITNIITGGVKRRLSERSYHFNMATPFVIVGKEVLITQLGKDPVISIPFTTDKGKFVVEVTLAER